MGGRALSAIIIIGGLLSYAWIAARLFWGGVVHEDHQVAVGRPSGLTTRLVAAAMFFIAGSGARGAAAIVPAGPERAVALAKTWARHVGAPGRTLDASGDMALGETGLAYDAGSDTLIGRVYVNMALVKGMDPEAIKMQRRMVGALNDPKIGGMYDRGGGFFVLDEAREAWYLTRAFPIAKTTPASLKRDMTRMQTVAATWTVKWFFEVAMIMHGKERPSTNRQTIQD